MKLNGIDLSLYPKERLKKYFLIMRLTSLLTLILTLQLSASVWSQNTTMSVKLKNSTLQELFVQIEKSTNYRFFYNNDEVDVNQRVSIDIEEKTVGKILTVALEGLPYSFKEMENKLILIERTGVPSNVQGINSQQKSVSGKVTDSAGGPLPGVSVVVKGTTTGVITDMDGKYSLPKVPENAILVFSFVGMKAQEAVVAGKTVLNVTLVEESIGIEEVVAIGYGMQKKSDLTGSVSSVNDKNIKNEPIQRMEQMLQGRISGVAVTSTSGAPDGGIMIRVRGANSINAGNDPLYVVDGVANSDLFKNLDVNDIQSMEVLKDASSTAIYGSRGANGVIIVTTKKGAQEKSKIQFETQQSWGTMAKRYDMLNAVEFANFYNDYRKTKGSTSDFYSPDQISDWAKNGGYDWQDIMFQTAYSKNYKLSTSGGSSKIRYYLSGNVRDAEGILIKSKYKKYGIRANIDVNSFDWLTTSFTFNASHDESTGNSNGITGVGGVIWDALTYSPTVGLKDSDGNWITDNVSSYQKNPYGRRMQNKDDIFSNTFGGNTKFSFILPIKGLTFDVLGSANYLNRSNYSLTSALYKLNDKNSATNGKDEYINWQNTNQLTYTNKWGVHSLTATAVAEFTKETSNNESITAVDLLSESVSYWNLKLGTVSNISNGYTKSTLASYLGRVMYQLKDKYLVTATMRRDGSSKFQGANKWGYFPSVALGWRVSEENFLKGNKTINNAKLRTSWGVTGNQGIGAYSTLGMLSSSSYSWGTATSYPGYWTQNQGTPDLTWEKTYQWDAGLDLGFFNNRLVATIDLYLKNTKDLLLQKAIPYYDGGGSVYANLGSVRNKGFEVSLNVIPVSSKHLNWESTVNVAYSKNEVVDMGGNQRLFPGAFDNLITFNPSVLQIGQPMGSLWGYEWLGLWKTTEATEAAKYGQHPGDNKFLDKNNDYVIDSNDQGIIGKAFPDVTFGWNNTISWKRFEFNVFFQGAIGADRLNLTRYGMSESISDARFITSKEGYYNMWTAENQDTNIPNPYSTTIKTNGGSTQYLESADYLRCKNLSVAYTLPIKTNSIKISLSVQNLFTITSYSGYDPEVTSSGTSDTRSGIETGAYPSPRTYTIGLRANF